MTGERLARLSLRFDAAYCIVVGLVVAASSSFASAAVALPMPLLVGIGGITALWGGYVCHASATRPIRARTRLVMIADLVASAGLALTGALAGTTVLTLATLALAVDVAAFAVSQGVALRRLSIDGSPGAASAG
ncbi:hypothetical protein CGZ93_02110 [Enemella dayhoffiae]|uniref:DUF2568 domain-containing protein n=1 Tax=Enemella dayhoffiae TaxID=2016507 RepID=A0A255HBC2_9ACTN|nr:hypothetical protein [Enemella dayhoffiae]OYO25260.1 hypothetical protein CGZ93_02110 [Enemella dayhoffiae]